MARTAIAAGLVALSNDAGALAGAGQTPDASNGNILSFSPTSSPATFGPNKVLLVITNSDTASHTAIIRSSGYTGAAGDAANSGIPAPGAIGNTFAQSTLGDLSVAVAASTTQVIGPLTTDRFTQPNNTNGGDLWIDWSASTSMKVWAYLLPVDVI